MFDFDLRPIFYAVAVIAALLAIGAWELFWWAFHHISIVWQ